LSLAQDFVRTARRHPDRVLVIGQDGSATTYREMLDQTRAASEWLSGIGITAHTCVVLSLANSRDFLAAYLGVLFMGAVAVLVDHRAPANQLIFACRETGAACWIGAENDPRDAPGRQSLPPGRQASSPRDPVAVSDADDALVLFTSGTIGTPKGVRLSHGNLRHTVRSITAWAGVGDDEREFVVLPLTHLFGLTHVHVQWTRGGSIVLEDGLRDPVRALRRVVESRATCLALTPTAVRLLLDSCPGDFAEACRRLRYVAVNSAPLAEADVRRLLAVGPKVRWYMYYGLTEASRSSAILYNVNPSHLGSVGRATPGTEIRVGSPTTPITGAPGEIFVRGPHVSPGYWGAPPGLALLDGGWLPTGDLGVLDADGFLTWIGRVREQVKVGGLTVAPSEVELVPGTPVRL
jgi:acyl-CoA synthetase (AMP-forming)/AMP-acid ligase II